jgi:DNA-binding CsgD family transcriptional regulator
MDNILPMNSLLFSVPDGFIEVPEQLKSLLRKFGILNASDEITQSFFMFVRRIASSVDKTTDDGHRQYVETDDASSVLYVAVVPWNEKYWVVHFYEEENPNQNQIDLMALSQRELEVLHWVAEGKDNTSISLIVSISAETVRKHVQNILKKLNCENRTSAAALYLNSTSRYRH